MVQTAPTVTEIAAGRVAAQSLFAIALLATAPALELTALLGLAVALDLIALELAPALDLTFALDLTTTLNLAPLDLTTLDLAVILELAAATAHIKIASDTILAMPTLPAMSTAPAKAAARTVTAPVPAGALPSAVIPAVPSPAKNELSVLDHVELICRSSQDVGRTRGRSLCTSTHQHSAGK